DRNFLNDGPLTREFEARVATLLGVKHCVAVTSGTTAISLALMALGIGPGDEVIVPDLTFIATANAARMAGATVKLVDVEPRRLALDPEAAMRAVGPRTKAIVTVDVNGRGADYGFFEKFCRERGLRLVCDAAEALGSSYAGRKLGSFGDAGCFSFSANKNVTSGQGGMIAVNDTAMYQKLIELKDQGRGKRGTGGDDAHPVLGFNFKFTDLQAAVALAQLDSLEERCAQAARRDAWFRRALADCPGVRFPDASQPGEIRLWADALFTERERVRRALDEARIGYRGFWFPLHTQPPYAAQTGPFPVATDVSARGLWLPSHFTLTEAQVDRTAGVIRKALGKNF
ncbi:MAG: DegT/DnrJ/EryC1/StrS family aminotransferase, partial [Proteobacteria bacterium]|nr:DegT/DnrJ/EryC1/StrS family aminotransferase [Pseudomonadota bacterium]